MGYNSKNTKAQYFKYLKKIKGNQKVFINTYIQKLLKKVITF